MATNIKMYCNSKTAIIRTPLGSQKAVLYVEMSSLERVCRYISQWGRAVVPCSVAAFQMYPLIRT